ncbi:MAG: glyoxalase [Betaproteobacteria bacterium]|nr:MAG: glyoxalase [Betaproteobacteria bacterium]TAG49640.1 MAG: glyoxalase [Betaproteobacteria bacterium]
MIHGMNHFTITAADREKTLAFYCGVLGMREGDRPDLGFPGSWLYADTTQAILHIYWDRPQPAAATGVIDHMAFSTSGLREHKARLDAANIPYKLQRQVGAGTWQLFCTDPNGAKVELDFEPSEVE